MTYDLLICGLGGQGILTLSEILGQAAVAGGLKAVVTMDRGLSQRGGSVHAHVRLGEDIDGPPYAPMIPKYRAHGLLSLEIGETFAYSDYVNGETAVVVGTTRRVSGSGADSSPAEGESEVRPLELNERPGKLLVVQFDAHPAGREPAAGKNFHLLGVLWGLDERLGKLLPAAVIRRTIASAGRGKSRDNLSLFRQGLARGASSGA
jgi:Pyruvate/2-oxoacid:ferredoxin oxidoreductase gamma subunit